LRVAGQANAAALARVVGQLGVGAKGLTAVLGLVAVNRGTGVFLCRAFGWLIALVHPQRVQHTLRVKGHRLKTVGDFLTILVHGEWGAERLPTIAAAQHADEARVGFGQRHGVADHRPALGAKGDFWAAFAIGRNRVSAGVQDACFAPLHSAAQRRALHKKLRLCIQAHHPQTAIGCNGCACGQLRALVAVL
jgi:hypothetical protein